MWWQSRSILQYHEVKCVDIHTQRTDRGLDHLSTVDEDASRHEMLSESRILLIPTT